MLENQQNWVTSNKALATFLALLAIGIAILVWWETKREAETKLDPLVRGQVDSLNGTRDSIEARIQDQRDALVNQADTAADRAHVVMNECSMVGNPGRDNDVMIKWKMKNVGKTPAYNAREISRYKVGVPIDDAELLRLQPSPADSGAVIGVGQTFDRTFALNSPGERAVHIAIVLDYNDILGKPHRTRVYIIYSTEWNTFIYTSKFNSSD